MTWKPIGSSGKFRVAPDQKRALGDIELNTESVLFYVADCLLGKNKQNHGEQQTRYAIPDWSFKTPHGTQFKLHPEVIKTETIKS